MKIVKWIIILIVITGLAFLVYATVKINQPAATTSHPQDFEISKGERAAEITARLADQNLVSSELLLEVYLRFKNAEEKLQAGSYSLDSNMTIPEIVEILTEGKVKASGKRVTIIEGWSIREISAELEDRGLVSRDKFTAAAASPRQDYPHGLEGFLFPDTYLFRENASAEDIVRKILANFDRKVGQGLRDEIRGQNRDFYEVLILASMVEREVGRNVKKGTVLSEEEKGQIAEERRIVAGIFLKRLEIDMALESDATLAYVTGSKSSQATFEELKIDSPYNTYKYRGLPPTPISNPSLDAIEAAKNPARTDYLFFLTAPDGRAYFAKTLGEHNVNRQKYLE